MASIIENGTAQQGKKVTGKTEVLESLGEFELALCECIHSAAPEDLTEPERLAERFASMKRCMEEMREGVLALQGVVQTQWPEQ